MVQWADPEHHRPVPVGVTMMAPELTAQASAYPRFEPLPDRDAYVVGRILKGR